MNYRIDPANIQSQSAGQLIPQSTFNQVSQSQFPPQMTSSFDFANEGLAYRMGQNQSVEEHMKKLKEKFNDLKDEIQKMEKNTELFKNHQLPLARVKKIMKSDEDVRMISAEAPVLFAKACEIFIIELTHRAWLHTEESKRRTLQRIDIANCIAHTDIFDFLLDIIPKEEYKATQSRKVVDAFANFPQMNQQTMMMKDFQMGSKALINPSLGNSLMGNSFFPGILPPGSQSQNQSLNYRSMNNFMGLKEESKNPNTQQRK